MSLFKFWLLLVLPIFFTSLLFVLTPGVMKFFALIGLMSSVGILASYVAGRAR